MVNTNSYRYVKYRIDHYYAVRCPRCHAKIMDQNNRIKIKLVPEDNLSTEGLIVKCPKCGSLVGVAQVS